MTPQPRKPRRVPIYDAVAPSEPLPPDAHITLPPPEFLENGERVETTWVTGDDVIYLRDFIRRVGRERAELMMYDLLHEQ